MAHNLENKNGKTSFASTQIAWHGLGQIVKDQMTAKQAIELAGLDYEVIKVPVFANVPNVGQFEVPEKFATLRSDTNVPLGIVGSRYEIVQNRDAFGFFDSIVGADMAMYETAGVLGIGERVFITAKMPDFIRIAGTDDLTEVYVILTSSHDGSGAVVAAVTPIRIVCANTLRLGLKQAVNKVSIRHTASAKTNLENAHKLLGISHNYISELNECLNVLAKKSVTDSQVKQLVEKLFVSEKEDSTRIKNIREAVMTSYFMGVGQENILGTGFGFINGVTHYLSHVKSYTNESNKFESLVGDGTSSKIADKALDLILSL